MNEKSRELRACPRCGVTREVNTARKTRTCMDCRSVLSEAERKLWAA